jgi:hypothetical protein
MKDKIPTGNGVPDPEPDQSDPGWIDKQIVMKRYFISDSTLKRWRKKKLIIYSSVGKKFYYLEADVQRMISSNVPHNFPIVVEVREASNKHGMEPGETNGHTTPHVRKPWWKRHRYYSERLVLFILLVVWLLLPTSMNASSIFFDSTRYGLGLALLIRFTIENLHRYRSDTAQPVNDRGSSKEILQTAIVAHMKASQRRRRYILATITALIFFVVWLFIPQKINSSNTLADIVRHGVIIIAAVFFIVRLVRTGRDESTRENNR